SQSPFAGCSCATTAVATNKKTVIIMLRTERCYTRNRIIGRSDHRNIGRSNQLSLSCHSEERSDEESCTERCQKGVPQWARNDLRPSATSGQPTIPAPDGPMSRFVTMRAMLRLALLIQALFACLLASAQNPQQTADILFIHARLLDGAGNPWRYADVAVKGDRIMFVGNAAAANVHAAETIDLHGTLYLAPGFIDLHTHCAAGLSSPQPKETRNYLMPGVTTVM